MKAVDYNRICFMKTSCRAIDITLNFLNIHLGQQNGQTLTQMIIHVLKNMLLNNIIVCVITQYGH